MIFTSYFVHPDGSFGGEYGSRNTYSFFPHGFELIAKWFPQTTNVNDCFILGLKNKLHANFEDDHIIQNDDINRFYYLGVIPSMKALLCISDYILIVL